MIIASNNQGKITEIKELLTNYEIKSLKEANINIDIPEDGTTFYDNALKKAQAIYNLTKTPILADDSGLCIKYLNNWPGVETHRFLNGTDRDRNNYILNKMKDIPKDERTCEFICTLIYYDGTNIIEGKGVLEGTISETPKGSNGFGFDEIFLLENNKTLAEISLEEKNKISARHKALVDLKNKLQELEDKSWKRKED